MCHLKHPVDMPDNSGVTPTAGAANDADALDAGMAPSSTAGATGSSHIEMQPTKFGKLLKVLMPIVHGGAVGAFGGNWRQPGSGFQASQQYFGGQANRALQQQDLSLRRQQNQNQEQNLQSEQQYRQQEGQRQDAQTAAIERGKKSWHVEPVQPGGKPHDILRNDVTGEIVQDAGEHYEPAAKGAELEMTTDATGRRLLVNRGTAAATPVTEPGGIPMEPEQSQVIPGMMDNQPAQPRVPVMAPATAADQETKIIPRMMGGRAHNILINAKTGADIKDEGEAPPTAAENNAPGAPGGAADPGASKIGDEFLNTITDPGYKAMVKQIGDYQAKMPGLGMMGSGARMKLLKDIYAYKPDYDETQFAQRNKTRSDFSASGATGKKVIALDTAISHLGTLGQAADALNNRQLPLWNAVANKTSELTGHPAVTNFNTAKTAVTSELGNAFRATGLSEKDIDSWQKNFDSAMSPQQFKGAIKTTVKLLQGRLEQLNDQWEGSMGQPRNFHFLSPGAARTLQQLAGSDADSLLKFDGYDPKNIAAGPAPRTNTGQVAPRPPAGGGFSQVAPGVYQEQ